MEVVIEAPTLLDPVVSPPVPPAFEWKQEQEEEVSTNAELYAFAQGSLPAVGYAVGSGGIVLRHFAGRERWTREETNVVEDLFGVAENLGVVCAVGRKGTAICSLDPASNAWRTEKSGTSKDLLAVSEGGAQGSFLAVGRGGVILRRVGERASRWQIEASGTTADLNGTNGVYAVGNHGTILRHEDGRWLSEPSGTTEISTASTAT